VKAAGIIVAIALALALQTTLARFLVRGVVGVDLVLVVVVYVALTTGSVTGLLTGAVAGLMQDVVTRVPSSIIGIGSLAKTVVGFLAGIVGTQFIVAQPLPRFVVFFSATVVHAVIFIGLYVLLDLRHFGTPVAAVSGQALGNAVVGVVAFQVVELLPGAVERRRAARTRLRR
jgi:rod shape-determining protein MreD